MAREIIKWYCEQRDCKDRYPEFVNWAYKDELVDKLKSGYGLICQMCGKGTKPVKPTVSSSGWLGGCCEFPYPVVQMPSGEPQAGWKDGAGNGPKGRFDPGDVYSRDQYIRKFQLDPEIYYFFKHPDKKRPSRLEPKPLPTEVEVNPPEPTPDDGPKYPDELKAANKRIDDELKKAEVLKNNGKLGPKKYLGVTGFLYKLRERRNAGIITDDMLNDDLKKMWKAVGVDD